MTAPFESFFRSREHARDTYLSRLFALFSEQVVRVWCMCPQAPYEDIGRPTLYEPGVSRGSTLDFTLRDRASGRTFVSELKCELEYDNYRYLRLTHASQLVHHTSTALQRLLLAAKEPTALGVRCKGKSMAVDGAILVWGATTPDGRKAVMREFGFADVLSVESIVTELQDWKPDEWLRLLDRYRRWTIELFDFLA